MPRTTEKTQADGYCPLCREPVVYEPYWSGMMRFHLLANGELVFLCPEPWNPAESEMP